MTRDVTRARIGTPRNAMQGFTLVELMIVIAIIGLLAALAVPEYQSYTVRTRVSDGINQFTVTKANLSESYLANSAMPSTAQGQALLPTASGSTVKQFTYTYISDTAATIDIIYYDLDGAGPMSEDDRVRFTATGLSGSGMRWECITDTTVPARYLPPNCR